MHWHSLPMQKSHRPHMGPLTKGMPLDVHSNNQTHSSLLSIVWIRAVENKTNTKRLERVQGMALNRTQLLTISQEHPTSPTILKEKLQRGQLG